MHLLMRRYVRRLPHISRQDSQEGQGTSGECDRPRAANPKFTHRRRYTTKSRAVRLGHASSTLRQSPERDGSSGATWSDIASVSRLSVAGTVRGGLCGYDVSRQVRTRSAPSLKRRWGSRSTFQRFGDADNAPFSEEDGRPSLATRSPSPSGRGSG